MLNSVKQFTLGFIHSVFSIFEVFNLFTNRTVCIKYLKIVILNIFALSVVNQILYTFENYLYNYDNMLVKCIYFLILFFHKIIYNIPIYIFCYIISLDKIGGILNFIKKNDNLEIESFENKLYFCLVSSIFYALTNIIYLIPYIGNYLNFIFLSYSYGYFCLEYSCHYKNINSIDKISIIEDNPFYFIGFGLIYGILVHIFSYINFFVIFVITFPLSVMKLIKMNIFNTKMKKVKSKIFIFPIIILNIILSIIDSFIISNYSIKI